MKQFYFIALLTLLCTAFAQAQVTEQEFQALKALYNATDGDNWTNRTGWENINTTATQDDVSTDWHGITTITEGHILNIDLGDNNLVGNIPDEISGLAWLTILFLDNNELSGVLSANLASITSLNTLGLHYNQLSGPIPDEWSELVNLMFLYVSVNPLNCTFPEILPSNIKSFEAYYCAFTGELPDIFDNYKDLYNLKINGNNLSGNVPASISRLPRLQELSLSKNSFVGQLPTLDSCLTTIEDIHLGENNFTGTIPETYNNIDELDYLSIYSNNLYGEISIVLAEKVNRLRVKDNFYTFSCIEPILSFFDVLSYYSPQKDVPITESSLDVDSGDQLQLDASTLAQYELGGNNNRYKWYFNGEEVYSGNSPVYTIAEADASHAGEYYFKVTNTVVTELTLTSEVITLSIIGGNEAPTDILLSANSVDENVTGVVGTLSATDNNPDDTFTFSLASGDGSNDHDNNKFSIDGANLMASTNIDYETMPICFIRISVNDGNGGIYSKDFELAVNNVDEAPVWDMDETTVIIDETAPDGSDVFTLIAIDPEASTSIYSISNGNTEGAFKITGNKLQVADNTKLDYDEQTQHVLTVVASDGNLNDDIELTVNLNKINQLPEADDQSFEVFENAMAGTIVGILEATDPDDEALSYTLEGTDSEPFELADDTLKVKSGAVLDYETQQQYEFLAVVSDGVSNIEFTVTVNLKDKEETTALNSVVNRGIKIFPNPVSDQLIILPLVQPERMRIISLSGQVVLETAPLSTSVYIDVSGLKKGVYIVEIQAGNTIYSQKIIKQ
jgi:hypothetical protein